MGQYEGHIAQRLSNLLPGLLGLHIGRDFVLFIRIPLGVFQQRKLAGEIADALKVCIGQPQDGVCLHQRHGGEDVIGNVAAAIDHHIGGDFTQAIDEFSGLRFTIGRIGVLVFALEHPQNGQVSQPFVGNEIVLDQVFGHMGSGQYASQRPLTLQLRRRANTGQHGGSHITQEQDNISLFVRQIFGDLHRHGSLAAAGAAPDGHYAALLKLRGCGFLAGRAGENTVFLKFQHQEASLSSVDPASGTSASSVSVESGCALSLEESSPAGSGGYILAITSFCTARNRSAFSRDPR